VVSSLSVISQGRMIAGIGTGDHLSRPENQAFGVPYESADWRRSRLVSVGSALRDLGIPVWVGGGLPRTIELAQELDVAVNLWEADPLRVAELTSAGMEVTWGGPVSTSVPEAAARLGELGSAGATWAVCAWPDSLDDLARAVELAGHAD
jgi:alkanesulfonate monooxygenase SsuD/methylene tetrahydromethanopterin reductase-like flavin-dependent oxidoreductase (luciferase family)